MLQRARKTHPVGFTVPWGRRRRMRALFCAVLLLLALPVPALAGHAASSLHLSSVSVVGGRVETLTVRAFGLSGEPLRHAQILAAFRFSARHTYHRSGWTNSRGIGAVSIVTPRVSRSTHAQVSVVVHSGYLSIPLSANLTVLPSAPPNGTPTPGPSPTSTATPVATAGVSLVAVAAPPTVTAPNPIWIAAHVQDAGGSNLSGVTVTATAAVAGADQTAASPTNAAGIAMLRFDTSALPTSATVSVSVGVSGKGNHVTGTVAVPVTVLPPPATTPTPPTAVPTDTPMPTSTAAPATPVLPTAPTLPTDTATPVATSTPLPTDTLLPTSTAVPTSTPIPNCPADQTACLQQMVNILNQDRAAYAAQYGVSLQPLSLNTVQSNGTGSCVGSIGHSIAMQQSGSIWHQNANYPAASWPNNVCVYWRSAGENVGMTSGGELQAMQMLDQQMMGEQHDPAFCSQYNDHACNIVSSKYASVGIGLDYVNGALWLTEDFVG